MPASSNRESGGETGLGLELKFQSAVNLIRSLPKKGQFQPSYDDASKVYGFYKQAQLGPCKDPKPGFWDVVGRAKWNAWSQLGDMSKDEAMESYVLEIKRLFAKLATSEEFEEQQAQFSDVIVPFCEATGLTIPIMIKQNMKAQNMHGKAEKIFDKSKLNRMLPNGHGHNNLQDTPAYDVSSDFANHINAEKSKHDALEVIVNGRDIKVMSKSFKEDADLNNATDNSFRLNGTSLTDDIDESTAVEASLQESGSGEITDVSNWDDSQQLQENSDLVKKIDSESSDDDDDIFCDSINPDDISGLSVFNSSNTHLMEGTLESTFSDMNHTDDSLLLEEEIPVIARNGNNIQTHSTPAFAIKQVPEKEILDGQINGAMNKTHCSPTFAIKPETVKEIIDGQINGATNNTKKTNLHMESANSEDFITINCEDSTDLSTLSSTSAAEAAAQHFEALSKSEVKELEGNRVEVLYEPTPYDEQQHPKTKKHHRNRHKDADCFTADNGISMGQQLRTRGRHETIQNGIEDELVREFSKRVSTSDQECAAHGYCKGGKDFASDDRHRHLVISARGGNSHSDLTSRNANTGARNRRQSEGSAARSEQGFSREHDTSQRPRRHRRRQNDSSSDSNTSSSGSRVRGETIGEQIVRALQRLEQDMQMVLLRLNSIEDRIKAANEASLQNSWTAYLPSRRMMMLLLWPVVINIVFAYWRRRKRK